MDKPATANVDAGMGCNPVLRKQYQITGPDRSLCNGITPLLQSGNGTGWRHASSGPVNVVDQPAAVKPGVRRVTAKAIGRTDKPDGIDRHIAGLVRGQACRHSRRPVGTRAGAIHGRGTATTGQQHEDY